MLHTYIYVYAVGCFAIVSLNMIDVSHKDLTIVENG